MATTLDDTAVDDPIVRLRRLATPDAGPAPVISTQPVMGSAPLPRLATPDLPQNIRVVPTAPEIARDNTTRDLTELRRLGDTGSGISQIKNPVGRTFARIGEGIETALLPQFARLTPGTEANHQRLINQQQQRLNSDLGVQQQQAQNTNLDLQPQLKQAALENATLKAESQAQHYADMGQHYQDQVESSLRQHGYKHDATGNVVPLAYEELSSQQQAIEDLKHSQQEMADANAALKKAQNDPSSPAFRLAQQRVDVARQNAQTAYGRLGLAAQNTGMRREMMNANLYGVGADGQALPGAAMIAGEDGETHPVGIRLAGNAEKQNKAVAGFQDVYGALDTLGESAKRLAAQNGGKLNTPGVIFALNEAQNHGGQVSDFLHNYLKGANARNLTPAERDYITNIASAHENIQFLRAGGTTDAQINRLTSMLPNATTPDLDYYTRQDRQIRATADRVGKGYTGISGGLNVPGRSSNSPHVRKYNQTTGEFE